MIAKINKIRNKKIRTVKAILIDFQKWVKKEEGDKYTSSVLWNELEYLINQINTRYYKEDTNYTRIDNDKK